MEPISLVTALGGFALAVLGNVALFWFGYGKLTGKVDGIVQRLDGMNGRMNRHSEDLKNQGQRVSRLEGKQEG